MSNYVGLQAWDMGFDAHLTVFYFGENNPEENKIRYFVEEFKDAMNYREEYVRRDKIDLFGPTHDVPVVRVALDPYSLLFSLRHRLSDEFKQISQFKDWNPHITLKLNAGTIHIPEFIKVANLGVY